ncbi:MAG: hypothetical protein HYZ07_02545 [Candidatus Harrisonbacteria bacterium]|nr:hypothetical protein [Candidatus Harrisonbacteria bacterium]
MSFEQFRQPEKTPEKNETKEERPMKRIEGSRLPPDEQTVVLEEIAKALAHEAKRGTGGFITRIRKFLGNERKESQFRIKRLIAESLMSDGAPGNSYIGLFALESGELLVTHIDLQGTEASVYHGRDKDTGLPKNIGENQRAQCYVAENYRALRSPTFLPENVRVRLGAALMEAGHKKEGERLLRTTKLKPIGSSAGLGSVEEQKLRAHVKGIESERKARAAKDAEELQRKKDSGEFERLWETRPKRRRRDEDTGKSKKP